MPDYDKLHPSSSLILLVACNPDSPGLFLQKAAFSTFPRPDSQANPDSRGESVVLKWQRVVSFSHTILIADDSADDLLLLRRSFAKAGIANPIREVRTGNQAISYLKGMGVYSDREKYPFPRIMLLDLHMPHGTGFEVLEWVRENGTGQQLLIIVLSSLNEIKSVNRAYSLGANSFLTKPGDIEQLQQLIQAFKDYWLLNNKPPALQN